MASRISQYPEIGWSEFLTTAKIVKVLRGLGLEVKVGPEVINKTLLLDAVVRWLKKLAVARKHHVDEALLDEMQELTGCVAIFDNSGKPGPTVALRFDIDCVGVTENNRDSTSSTGRKFRLLSSWRNACLWS